VVVLNLQISQGSVAT